MKSINLQLYSVQELLETDFWKTMDEIARIGYTGVEFAGYFDYDAKTLRREMDNRNLQVLSSHVPLPRLQEHLAQEIEYAKILDCEHLVCPGVRVNTLEKVLETAELLNRIGEECLCNGITFSYHNHDFEFQTVDGKPLLDYLYENTDPRFLKAQLDVYWVAMGKHDPYEYVKKYADRMPLIHLKQFSDFTNVDAPDGTIDFKKVMELTNGAIPIYEQENLTCENGIPSITRSFAYMNTVL